MPAKPFASAPLYVQLRSALSRRIADGEWKPGEPLPNETELAREYGLSAGTVRRALDWMEEVRLVTRQQGRGTFVTDQTSREQSFRFDRLRDATGGQLATETDILEMALAEASKEEASLLSTDRGARVMRVRRLHRLAGAPIMLEAICVPVSLFPSLAEDPKDYDLLANAKVHAVLIGKGEESISMIEADAETAGLLGLGSNEPVAYLERVIYTIEGQPAELRKAHCTLKGIHYVAEYA